MNAETAEDAEMVLDDSKAKYDARRGRPATQAEMAARPVVDERRTDRTRSFVRA